MAVVFAFIACDEEFTEIGGEIINNPSNVELRQVEVNAYSKKLSAVQTNGLSSYFLGTVNHPTYGESTASIVTQLSLSNDDPDFGENIQLDSVVMTIPYFSTEVESNEDESEIEYELDSVYGSGSFNLKIYETGYFLNNLDPDAEFGQRQKYYSDQQGIIEQNILGEPIYSQDNFEPSAESYVSYELDSDGETDTITNRPAFRVNLPVDYFKEKIVNKLGSVELLDNSNFQEYFRSLFLKAESNGTDRQILFNLSSSDAKIMLYYTSDQEDQDGEVERARGIYALNFSGANRFNTYTGEFPSDILANINGQSSETGSENLYLRGQEGSMAVIDLFPDEDVLTNLREEELLINEADLTFYVREDLASESLQPRRLYIYDLTNNTIISDYGLDVTLNTLNPENSLTTFSEPIKIAEDGSGSYYRLRITNHVSNLINDEDAENVKLGLVIVPNINSVVVRDNQGGIAGIDNAAVKNESGIVKQVPTASVLTPYGTVLHGNTSADDDKRLKLNIYYTNFN
ncbi:DUF4270 domain-containing protein [Christiangramia sp. SM2212]|nr:DUF4270 domain-containing protein [Christiangramia sp. SM2212]